MDWVFGTSVGGDLGDDMRDEAEKHHAKERVQRKSSSALTKGRDKVNGAVKRRAGRNRSGS